MLELEYIVNVYTDKFCRAYFMLMFASYQITAVNLVDAHYVADPAKFISVMLLSLTQMIQLELPAINVLSKVDLIEQYGKLRKFCNPHFFFLSEFIVCAPGQYLSVSC